MSAITGVDCTQLCNQNKKTVRAYLFESHATCRLTYAESLIDLVSERPKAREESHQLELVLFSHAFVYVFFYWQRC